VSFAQLTTLGRGSPRQDTDVGRVVSRA
jgi:hypothetical protein